ncbi:hypothetical protein HPS57_11380 [Prevotella sp. PINT]|nr:hypothetical protein [Palleniella intestinalis]NPD82567.1 hypothetical protein [Palleniella intestinalis]
MGKEALCRQFYRLYPIASTLRSQLKMRTSNNYRTKAEDSDSNLNK